MLKKFFPLILVIVILALIGGGIFLARNAYLDVKAKRIALEKRKASWVMLESQIKQELNNFPGDVGIIIEDLSSGWQIRINADKRFAAASLAKIPILAGALLAVKDGKLSMQEKLRLKGEHKVLGSGQLKSFPSGLEFSLEKLFEFMIAASDNTATNMVISRFGMDYFEGSFKILGLKDTNLSRKMMDFRGRNRGRENYTSAKDISYLLEQIYRGRLINPRYSRFCLELLKKQKIRDRIPAKLPEDVLVAHKTGLEKGVCHDAGIIFMPKTDILVCVLTKHHNGNAKPSKNFIARAARLAYNYGLSL